MRWLNSQRIERGIRFLPFVPGPGFSLPPPAGQGMAEPLLIFDRRYPCEREMRLANSKKTDKRPNWTSGPPVRQCPGNAALWEMPISAMDPCARRLKF
jgi:hypothetical protein